MSSLLTKSEIHAVSQSLHRGMRGKFEREHFELVMLWAEVSKLHADHLQLILEGYLDIVDIDEDGMPVFLPTEKGLQSSRRQELERLRV
jgi:hypothetical protein